MPKPSMAKQGRAFVQHIVPAVIKPMRALWNEVIGFIFLCFAVIFGFRAGKYIWNLVHDLPGSSETSEIGRMAITVFCTLLTAYFGITSFLRARRISRS